MADGTFPAWSPDGREVAFVSVKIWNEFTDVCVVELASSKIRTLQKGEVGFPLWAPDGKEIVYIQSGGEKKPQLRAINADGTNDRVVSKYLDVPLQWTADGTHVIATRVRIKEKGESPDFSGPLYAVPASAKGEAVRLRDAHAEARGGAMDVIFLLWAK